MTKPLGVTNHCIVRFLERIDGYDFTELKLEYMLENSILSMRHINDREFVHWIDLKLDVQPFRDRILNFINPFITASQRKDIENKPKKKVHVYSDDYVFIIAERNIITVRKKEKYDLSRLRA